MTYIIFSLAGDVPDPAESRYVVGLTLCLEAWVLVVVYGGGGGKYEINYCSIILHRIFVIPKFITWDEL